MSSSLRGLEHIAAQRSVGSASPTLLCCLLLASLLASAGCKRFERKHIPVQRVQELGYPSCAGQPLPDGEVFGQGDLRAGATHPDKSVVERFTLRKRGCLYSATVRQEWPLATADVEVLYDAKLAPIRIWKRMTFPGLEDPGKSADIRRYELRTSPVEIKRKLQDGTVDFEQLKGGAPQAVIGPGRGLISMWIKRAGLKPGQKVRELAIDVRALETIEPVTLLREPDMVHRDLGPVRVYTFYGRETVFTDANGIVVGDLLGLRPANTVSFPPPPAIPLFGILDPVHTP
jgi:hypothetical protein